MNTNQYTQKTLEALQAAQQLAVEYQHNALEPEHLLHALASQEQGLIPQLLQKLNVDPGSFAAAVAEKLSALPRCPAPAATRTRSISRRPPTRSRAPLPVKPRP